MYFRYLLVVALLGCCLNAQSQGAYIPLGTESYHLIDRLEIKSGFINQHIHTSVKPYSRQQTAAFLQQVGDSELSNWSGRDDFNWSYLSADNHEWTHDSNSYSRKPVLKKFYREKAFLFSHQGEGLDLYVNPVFDFNGGYSLEKKLNQSIYTNSRGFEIRGAIGKKLGFYTYFSENQTRLPYYVDERADSTDALPGVGFLKNFGSNGYDYLLARGYITFAASKYIDFQFGHDRNFSGNGYRSLVLSDFAREYLFLKVNTKVWKLHYQNMFMELFNGSSFTGVSSLVGKKYAAHHHLSMNLSKNFNLGLAETVVFSRSDSLGSGGFDFNYLNPVIFYRSVEQNLNSADNAMIGLDFKWNLRNHYSLYGQFMLDEFVLNELRSGNGWWANKFAIQGGVKVVDLANVPNLDLQLEMNLARPYTYTHFNISQNYTHYSQPLAHPLGANFTEAVAIIRYQPWNRMNIRLTVSYAETGLDSAGRNYGADLFKSYDTHYQDYGNRIGQGDKTKIAYAECYISYMFRHNLFLYASGIYRKSSSLSGNYNRDEMIASLGLRLNIPYRSFHF